VSYGLWPFANRGSPFVKVIRPYEGNGKNNVIIKSPDNSSDLLYIDKNSKDAGYSDQRIEGAIPRL